MVKVFGRFLVDLASGTVRHTLPESPASMVQDDDAVCTLRNGVVRAFGLADGAPRWEAALPALSRQMTIDRGELFVATRDAVISFTLATGTRRDLFAGVVENFVVSGDTLAIRVQGGDVVVAGRDGAVRSRIAASPADRLPNGVDHLLEGSGEVPAVILEALEHRFLVRGVRADGGIAWKAEVDHSEMLSRDASSGMYFYLNFEAATERHLLFTSHWSTFRHPASVVLRVADGARVAENERQVSALVERADGTLEGLLTVDPVKNQLVLLEPGGGKTRWSARAPSATHRRADAALTGSSLAVVQYDAVAAGARLVLLDLADGLTNWQGDVEERPAFERTPLFLNAWSVRVEGNRVVLLGDESAGTTAQVFDLADGRRLWSALRL